MRHGLAILLLSSAGAQSARAQTFGLPVNEPDDVPGRRVLPEYARIGYDLAGFQLLPTVAFGIRADDNVLTRSSVKRSDIVFQAAPKIRLARQDGAQNISIEANIQNNAYLRLSKQDSTEYSFQSTYTRGNLDRSLISANFGYRREAIQRGTVENDISAGEPLMRRVVYGALNGRKRFNRLSVDTQFLSVRQRYENLMDDTGLALDQQFRNVDRLTFRGAAAYDISGRTGIVGSLDYDRFDYATSPLLIDRDAQNWTATLGLRYEIGRVLYAQFSAGYRCYDFKKPELGRIKGPAITGHLRYFPTRLLAIRGNVEQYNTTSPYDLVSNSTITIGRVEVEYEMRRSISWIGAAKIALEHYSKQPYSAQRLEITGGPHFRFNRWLAADVTMGFSRRFVNGIAPFEPYSQLYAILSVTLAK